MKYSRFLNYKVYDSEDFARSPLDIPSQKVMQSFLAAVLFCVISGSLFCWGLYKLSLYEIQKTKFFFAEPEGNRYPLVEEILADWSTSWAELSKKDSMKIISALGSEISVNSLASLAGKMEKEHKLSQKIVGDFNVFLFSQSSADSIADDFYLTKKYNSEASEKSIDDWKRALFIASIQKIRGKLSAHILKPRRLLQALLGPIQWITFISAVWCLIMLLGLRMPWANTQLTFVKKGKLPFLEYPNVWENDNYRKYEDASPRKYLAPRLISEFRSVNPESRESTYSLITDRVDAFRDSVEIGEYDLINYLIWAAPTFGFIGTIYGIISAMEKAGAILSATERLAQAEALNQISASLGTAFDTSLVALVWLVPMSFALARTRKKESNLFEELEKKSVETFLPNSKPLS